MLWLKWLTPAAQPKKLINKSSILTLWHSTVSNTLLHNNCKSIYKSRKEEAWGEQAQRSMFPVLAKGVTDKQRINMAHLPVWWTRWSVLVLPRVSVSPCPIPASIMLAMTENPLKVNKKKTSTQKQQGKKASKRKFILPWQHMDSNVHAFFRLKNHFFGPTELMT